MFAAFSPLSASCCFRLAFRSIHHSFGTCIHLLGALVAGALPSLFGMGSTAGIGFGFCSCIMPLSSIGLDSLAFP